MKKKNLKSLKLKKTSVSNLSGGASGPVLLSLVIKECVQSGNLTNCTTGTTTWISELNTACCPPSQGFDCNQSFLNPCQLSVDVPCQP